MSKIKVEYPEKNSRTIPSSWDFGKFQHFNGHQCELTWSNGSDAGILILY